MTELLFAAVPAPVHIVVFTREAESLELVYFAQESIRMSDSISLQAATVP